MRFLLLHQVLQILVSSDALQFILDNLLDILLYPIVVVLNGLLHAVVAIGILEIVDDWDRLIMAFLSLYFVGVNDNLGMEDLLLYALGEVVGNRSNKHTLGESANLAWRNETVHLGIDGCRDILTVDGNGLTLLEHFSKTLGQSLGGLANDLSVEDVTTSFSSSSESSVTSPCRPLRDGSYRQVVASATTTGM